MPDTATLPLYQELEIEGSISRVWVAKEMPLKRVERLTVRFYLSFLSFNNFTELRPFRKILKIEAYVVRFCEMIEITGVESE